MTTENYVFVDIDGDEIKVYDQADEMEARTFAAHRRPAEYGEHLTRWPSRGVARYEAEKYAAEQAALLGCDWGVNA